jgi:hypothetical protein
MDESHAPLRSPAYGYQSYFIGWISAQLERNGQLTREDWESALVATDSFQREQKIANQEQSAL